MASGCLQILKLSLEMDFSRANLQSVDCFYSVKDSRYGKVSDCDVATSILLVNIYHGVFDIIKINLKVKSIYLNVKPKEGGFLLVSPFNHLDGI
jgi:hypothetical protein